MNVRIRKNDRADFFGKTGSGKTTLARACLNMTDLRHVVLDPKWRYTDPGSKIVHTFNPKLDRQIVRIAPGVNDLDHWNETIFDVWDRGESILYIDEVTLLLPGTRTVLPWHRRAIVTGRERDLAVWNGTQRPTEIGSSVIFTEAEHFFLFRLQFAPDIDKVASFTGEQVPRYYRRLKAGGRAAKHDFIYYNPEDDAALYVNATRAPTRGQSPAGRPATAPAS